MRIEECGPAAQGRVVDHTMPATRAGVPSESRRRRQRIGKGGTGVPSCTLRGRGQANALDSERDDGVERRAPMLETVVGCAVRRRERLSAPDAPISTAFPGSRSVETVADEVPGTDASMDRTCGIGTSAILPFGLALVDERTASLEIGLKL